MALLSILFDRPTLAKIGVMQLDASISEAHVMAATVTDHEIEDGTNITDHVRLQPNKLTIEGLVSDSPVTIIGALIGAGITSVLGEVNKLVPGGFGSIAAVGAGIGLGSLAGAVTGSPRDPRDAFKYLEELFQNRQPFTIITALKQYESMLVENLTVPRSAEIGKSLKFTMQVKQVRIVQSASVLVPSISTRNSGGVTKSKLGKQAGKLSDNESPSLLAQAFDKGKELLGGFGL